MKPISSFALILIALTTFGGGFQHRLEGRKPWTGETFLNDPQEFHFAVIGDRTGSERKGFFGKAVESLNLLRPEFAICVGDLIAGGGVDEPALRRQWAELRGFVSRLEMPFFHVVGNHDIWTGFDGMTPARRTSVDLWKENCGTNTYYSFLYKAGKRRVVLIGDETVREKAKEFGDDWQVFDFGFEGDRIQNVLWRVIEGEIRGYDPRCRGDFGRSAQPGAQYARGSRGRVVKARGLCPRRSRTGRDSRCQIERRTSWM